MKLKTLDRVIVLTGLAGILISTYAMYVEMSVESQPGYKALCDISEHASCSRVLSSKYAKGFGLIPADSSFKIPNCIYGIVFYCIMIFLSTFDHLLASRLMFVLALSSIATSLYLAYLLAFVLYDFCLVCVSTYVVNGVLATLVYKKITRFRQRRSKLRLNFTIVAHFYLLVVYLFIF